jgi:hypothetical protein
MDGRKSRTNAWRQHDHGTSETPDNVKGSNIVALARAATEDWFRGEWPLVFTILPPTSLNNNSIQLFLSMKVAQAS